MSPLVREEHGDDLFFHNRRDLTPSAANFYCGEFAVDCTDFHDVLEWRPSHCHLMAWDAGRFCNILYDRSLLFIGDSVMG